MTLTEAYFILRQISKAIKNPDYNSWTLNNDAALLKADRPFDLNQAVHPVCSPKRTDDFSSDDATVSGWGTTRSGGNRDNRACCPGGHHWDNYPGALSLSQVYCSCEDRTSVDEIYACPISTRAADLTMAWCQESITLFHGPTSL